MSERTCGHCGSDTYFAQEFPRIRDENYALRNEHRRIVAKMGALQAEFDLWKLDHETAHRSLQGKAHRQRIVINRLEKRLRDRGMVPHAQETP